eukprot:TRINITY_DN29177_c1_g1_i1.p1 TRINITY_DN29177_c1_g1~~TRINITY_DN29177_c1_g1_i1.p1  ORF type:complete len:109 (+),score=34.97 TRINITY_DN29177_c1_g1_i1:64-390(+)
MCYRELSGNAGWGGDKEPLFRKLQPTVKLEEKKEDLVHHDKIIMSQKELEDKLSQEKKALEDQWKIEKKMLEDTLRSEKKELEDELNVAKRQLEQYSNETVQLRESKN